MKINILITILSLATSALAQPASEIYLFDLSVKKGVVRVSHPKNISNHPGYDSQPSFNKEKPVVYYTSFNADGRADIKSYNYKTGERKNITSTSEREYSPTQTPDKKHLSCIIQRDNNAQDLGMYPIDGGEPTVLINTMTVGYHAWADANHLAMFILGQPLTLHYYDLASKRDTVLAENIGRSLHKMPAEEAISFVHKTSEKEWVIKKFNTKTLVMETIAAALPGREDITWTPKAVLLTSDGSKLFYLDGQSWKEVVVEDGGTILKGVTRLAVNSKGDKLCVVVAE